MGPRLTLLDTTRTSDDDYVDTTIGVSAVLRTVAATRSRAVVYLDGGSAFIHTSILGVEQPAFFFEKGPDPALNARVLAHPEVTLVTADRSVPVQFPVTDAELGAFEGVEAFRAPL